MEIERLVNGEWVVEPLQYVMAGKGVKVHIQPYLWENMACFCALPTEPVVGAVATGEICKKCMRWLRTQMEAVARQKALELEMKSTRGEEGV